MARHGRTTICNGSTLVSRSRLHHLHKDNAHESSATRYTNTLDTYARSRTANATNRTRETGHRTTHRRRSSRQTTAHRLLLKVSVHSMHSHNMNLLFPCQDLPLNQDLLI